MSLRSRHHAAKMARNILSDVTPGMGLKMCIFGSLAAAMYTDVDMSDKAVDIVVALEPPSKENNPRSTTDAVQFVVAQLLQFSGLFAPVTNPRGGGGSVLHRATKVQIRFHDLNRAPFLPVSLSRPTRCGRLPCFSAVEMLLQHWAHEQCGGGWVDPAIASHESQALLLLVKQLSPLLVLPPDQYAVAMMALRSYCMNNDDNPQTWVDLFGNQETL